MKSKPTDNRQRILVGLLWLAAVVASLPPVGSAFGIPQLNVLGSLLDSAPHISTLYLLGAGGALLLLAAVVYALGLNPLAPRRSLPLTALTAMAPGAFVAAWLVCFDRTSSAMTLATTAAAPGALLGPPVLLLIIESLVRAVAENISRTALARDWRRTGVRASRTYLRLKPDSRAMQARIGQLLTSEDNYRAALPYLMKLGPVRGSDDQPRLRALERAFRALGARDKAIIPLEELVRLNPVSQGLANKLLDDYLALDRHEEALRLLEVRQIKDSLTRLKLRQTLLLALKRYDESFAAILKIEPYDDDTKELTIRLDRELLKHDPERLDAAEHLGMLLIDAIGEDERIEGAAMLENVLKRSGALPLVRRRLIAYYREIENIPATEPHMDWLVRAGDGDPDAYLAYSALLLRQEREPQAADVLERMTRAIPDNWQGHLRLSRLRLRQGAIDDAIESLGRAESTVSAEGRPSVEHLRNDIENWTRDRAIAGMHSDLKEKGRDPKTWLRLIDELMGAERIDETLHQCEALLVHHPEARAALQQTLEAGVRRININYRLLDYLADLYFDERRYADLLKLYRSMAEKTMDPDELMIKGLRRILERVPEHLAARQELAVVQRGRSNWEGVLEALDPLVAAHREGAAMDPGDRALWVEAAYRTGGLEEAREIGMPLARELASEAGFMLLMIDILQTMQDHAGAFKIYELANAAIPDDPQLKRLARRIDYDRKQQRLGQLNAIAIDDLKPEEHFEKAELHREFSQPEKAIIHYQRAAYDPGWRLRALAAMAATMCDRGMYDIAFETMEPIEFTREIDLQYPELKHTFFEVGRSMEAHKRFDKAVVLYKRIFRVDASYKDVVLRLQRLG